MDDGCVQAGLGGRSTSPSSCRRSVPTRQFAANCRSWIVETLTEFDELVANLEERRAEANRRYEAQALSRNASFFDSVESQPLSPTQRLACVRDEDNNLVLAGAGSGKTSVIVARAAYLVDVGLVKPEEILVLAFNADAAQEVRDRLTRQVENHAGLTVATFHAFGKAVATAGMARQPSVSRLAQAMAPFPSSYSPGSRASRQKAAGSATPTCACSWSGI